MIDESGFMHAPIVPLTADQVSAARRIVNRWATDTERSADVVVEVLDLLGIGEPPTAIVEAA